jgi:hypothetical protein
VPYSTSQEVYDTIGQIFERAVEDHHLGPAAQASGTCLQLRYTDPDAVITADFPNRKVHFGDDTGTPTPTVTLISPAALGNRYWLGRLNLTVALAKRDITSKGPVTKILKLVPLTKPLFASYEAILREQGRLDLLQDAGIK